MADAASSSTSGPASPPVRAEPPLSPHLQIWRFTATMAASITQRFTGVINFTGTMLLALWLFTAAQGPAAFAPVGGLLSSPIGLIILTGYIWSLSFHAMNGLRYLYWDSGRGFAPKMASMTAWLAYGGSIVLTAIIVIAGLSARGGA